MPNIDRDARRFRQIVRGRIRRDLRRYMSTDEMIGRQGDRVVSLPLPQIEIPRFVHGKNQQGVGSGDGEPGDEVGEGTGEGAGTAGEGPGQHILEVDVTIEELAEIMGEELELPNIQPKQSAAMDAEGRQYKTIAPVGPNSLRHFKRTYRQALRRQIGSGTYNPADPVIVPIKDDMRYRQFVEVPKPRTNAVILYLMDVSGSMGDAQKQIVRMEAFWIDTWLTTQYDNLESVFVVHDAVAREVDRETFFHLKESGGTLISSAYKVALEVIEQRFPLEQWNIYIFQFSDGDNWSGSDTKDCMALLEEKLLPASNLFCYGQVESAYGSGQYLKDLERNFDDDERVVMSKIPNKDAVFDSIKTFLGTGR